MHKESTNSNKDLEEVQKLLKSPVRDCVVQERNSFVAFQAKLPLTKSAPRDWLEMQERNSFVAFQANTGVEVRFSPY